MKLIFPNSQRINRGNYKKTSLAEACVDKKITDLILLKEHRGVPGQLCVLLTSIKFEWDCESLRGNVC
jgi:U3 small nucleolar ribonucleoprotein protein IMP4